MIYSWNAVRKKFKIKKSFLEYYKFIGLDFFEILTNLNLKKKILLKLKKLTRGLRLKLLIKLSYIQM